MTRPIWLTDGTLPGTRLVGDLRALGAHAPRSLIVLDGRLHFLANDAQGASEIWRMDGNGNGTMRVGPVGGMRYPSALTPFRGDLCFAANDPALSPDKFCEHPGLVVL